VHMRSTLRGKTFLSYPYQRLLNNSSSTGPPKGVDVSHRNVTNLLCNYPGNLNIRRGTKVAQLLSISFDMGKLILEFSNTKFMVTTFKKESHV
jgi:long-subunit acyl-CoA synthetase (AMP-forming)